MAEKEITWEKTIEALEQRNGGLPRTHRYAFNAAHLERTNGNFTVFYSREFDAPALRSHEAELAEVLGLPVQFEYRANGNGNGTHAPTAPAEPKYERPQLRGIEEIAARDWVGFKDLQQTFSTMPFQIFDNNRAATELIQHEVIDRFPHALQQKTRPYVLVGGVGIGKTSTIESAVYSAELKRRKAIAAFREADSQKAVALLKEVLGTEAQSERELWEQGRGLASARICYETAAQFKADYSEVGELSGAGNKDLASARFAKFNKKHMGLDLWVIDDLQMLARGKPVATLERLYTELQNMYNRGKPVIITSDESPAAFGNFPEHTRSRLSENICNLGAPSEEDKRRYLGMKFAALDAQGVDVKKYAPEWTETLVQLTDHYRHINAVFNNIANNNRPGQQSLFTPAQSFEQALDMIHKDKKQARGAYAAYRVLTTVASLTGRTEKELRMSEVQMRRDQLGDELLAKRTALVLAKGVSDVPPEELASMFGYFGTPRQRANTVEGILKECGNISVFDDMPIEQQFHRVYQAVRENLDAKSYPLLHKKK